MKFVTMFVFSFFKMTGAVGVYMLVQVIQTKEKPCLVQVQYGMRIIRKDLECAFEKYNIKNGKNRRLKWDKFPGRCGTDEKQ